MSGWKKLKAAVKFTTRVKRATGESDTINAHVSEADVDIVIEHLMETRGKRRMRLKERKVSNLVNAARLVILQEPMLLEVEPPINICGDLHGQFSDAVRVFDICKLPARNNRFLFLGAQGVLLAADWLDGRGAYDKEQKSHFERVIVITSSVRGFTTICGRQKICGRFSDGFCGLRGCSG